MFKVRERLPEKDFAGQSPTPFVGRFGYPYVNVGLLTPVAPDDDVAHYDAPRFWGASALPIPRVVDYRSALVNSRFTADIRSGERILNIVKEVGMASRPVDLEIGLKDKPSFSFHVDMTAAPHGPSAVLDRVHITSNPKVDTKVDKVVSDTDWKAVDAMNYLYEHEFDENFLSRMLSVGNVGIKANRRLVPTRWSITAVDDSLGKRRIMQVKDFEPADYQVYVGGYLGNYYIILFYPEPWSYELFESYIPAGVEFMRSPPDFATDFEPYEGRKEYAKNTVGGYYAARLPILDRLHAAKRQASVLALRFITDEYAIHLGVWVVREATRNAMLAKPLVFSSRELMEKYVTALLLKRFGVNAQHFFTASILLRRLSTQRKLSAFGAV